MSNIDKSMLCEKKPAIIIAAYNEESSIDQLLTNLGGGKSNLFQIVVMCNGCTDNTEKTIRTQFPDVYLGALQEASKSLAIRAAETLDIGFPRLYLDADIGLSEKQAESLFNAVKADNQVGLFVPASKTDTKSSSYLVDQYYQAWYSTSFVKEQGFGCGCYIINQSSREAFGLWPELISDDGFLRAIFDNVVVINEVCVTVTAPKTILSLLKIKTRSKYGNIELKQYLQKNNLENLGNKRVVIPAKLSLTHKTIYSFVNAYAKAVAYWKMYTGTFKWHTDHSSR